MDSRFSFSLYSSIITLVSLVIVYFVNQQIVVSNNETLLTDLKINLSEVEVRLENEFASFREDIGFLYTTPPISGLTRAQDTGVDPLDGTTTALWKSRLEKIFTGFMQHNRNYFQLRIIDSKGEEFIRVERVDNLITARDANDLQNKSNRDYFIQASALADGQLFVSTIDLNRENGQLEFPYRPTLRLARPIFGEDNRFFGIIIVNIDVSYLLDELDNLVTNKYNILLTDNDGYFIKHPEEKLQFSRDLAPSLNFSGYYSVASESDSPIKRYQTANQIFWGLDNEITVSGRSHGSELHPYIMLSDDIYKAELNKVRVQIFSALGGIWAAALLGLFLLSHTNKRLANLLKIAEEAQSAVNAADDAILTVNHQGHINTVNNAFENIFLVHRNECLGKSITELYAGFGCDELQHRFSTGALEELQIFEWKFKREGAPDKWLKTKILPVKNSKSEAAFAIVTGDITVEKQASTEIEQNNRRLEAIVNKRTLELKSARDKALEVSDLKSNFISTISHEMRTPLNGIVGAVSLLKNQTLNSQQIELVQMAENSVDALRRLINDVLDLSKIEAGKLEFQHRNFNPEALVESIASTMSVVAGEKALGFYIDTVDLNVSMINSDPHRLTQVLTNLLNNAIKFTDQGYVLIKAWDKVEDGNCWIYLEVTDTGTGIAENHLDRLFKAFSQADEGIAAKYGGTGLGLSICKELVDLLGGKISVDSTKGKGSTFHVALPVFQWEEKSPDGMARLNNQTVGMLINQSPLHSIVKRLIESHGGTPLWITGDSMENDWAKLTMLMAEYNHNDFSQLITTYHTVVEKLQRNIKLIVISSKPLNDKELPQHTVNMVEPVNRSAFLSSVLDSRGSTPSLPWQSEMIERRCSDMPFADETKTIDSLNCRILVVDDNEINTQVARFILEPHNIKVAVVENGEKAIQHLSSAKDTFDIILMDCNMPVMNGYEATRAIRAGRAGEHYGNIPIIAMTANAMKGESEKCMAAGMTDYITKPVEPSLLIRKISQHIPDNKDKISTPTSLEADNTPPAMETDKMRIWNKDEALVRLGGREALLVQLLHLFIKGAEQKLAAMQLALEEQDREKLRFTAHALKGNAGDVGAEALHRHLAELENRAPEAPFDSLKTMMQTSESLLTETLEIFEDFLQSHS